MERGRKNTKGASMGPKKRARKLQGEQDGKMGILEESAVLKRVWRSSRGQERHLTGSSGGGREKA